MTFRGLLLSAVLAVPRFAVTQEPIMKPAPEPAPSVADQEQAQATNQNEAQPADQRRTAASANQHRGGKDDVDAIGTRKVGGINIYSMDADIKIGKRYAQEIERNLKFVQDPVIIEYVNRVGQNLVRNSDAKVPFTIKVVDDDTINAMALPGGFLYVNSGVLMAADDEAELAGVMAHEIAHVALRHATRTMTRAQILNLAMTPLIFVGGVPGMIGPQVARVAVPATLLQFSRNFETEADYFGTQYMYKAGYDPNALMTFFEKIQAREKKKTGMLSKAFSTHPQTPERMKKSQDEIASILPPRDHYVETTSEFSDVKARLAALRSQRKPDDTNPNKPTLRKTASPASRPDEEKKDDDRPVLRRRYTAISGLTQPHSADVECEKRGVR